MNKITLIRFAWLRRTIVCALEYEGKKICNTTSQKKTMLAPGIYDNGGDGFHNLTWFAANDLRMDKWGRLYLMRVLTTQTINTVTII